MSAGDEGIPSPVAEYQRRLLECLSPDRPPEYWDVVSPANNLTEAETRSLLTVTDRYVQILSEVVSTHSELSLPHRQRVLDSVPQWLFHMGKDYPAYTVCVIRALIWNPYFTLALQEVSSGVLPTPSPDDDTSTDTCTPPAKRAACLTPHPSDVEKQCWETARQDFLDTCVRAVPELVAMLERISAPSHASKEGIESIRLDGQIQYLTACLSGVLLRPCVTLPPDYTPCPEMIHEAACMKLTSRGNAALRSQLSRLQEYPVFASCALANVGVTSGGRFRARPLSVTPDTLYQSYRDRRISLFLSSEDSTGETWVDNHNVWIGNVGRMVRAEACVVGIGPGLVIVIQGCRDGYCRIARVSGYAEIGGFHNNINKSLGTFMDHPLAGVRVTGYANPFGRPPLPRNSRASDYGVERIQTLCQTACLFRGCVYYIARLDYGDGRKDSGIRVFECPLDTLVWREIGGGENLAPGGPYRPGPERWFPGNWAFTEVMHPVGDSIVCVFVGHKIKGSELWAFDPQGGDGDINVRRYGDVYPPTLHPIERDCYGRTNPLYSRCVQMGETVYRVRVTDGTYAHLLARDTVTGEEEVCAEIDRQLTSPYITEVPVDILRPNRPRRAQFSDHWRPLLTKLSRDCMYCVIGAEGRGGEETGFVIRLNE
ncbi:hypothetical protein KIPB_001924 [Kipferlia bialata]|uniref:Uncharacterized protein n=1 Tax=Kipferlia bialata TaxID=797122 RepID=A0A9K3CPL8_9EUKA|nr:hypothetical protein KIPB_001924 [Kipferlia bialata]|eukprot:g1924.t1